MSFVKRHKGWFILGGIVVFLFLLVLILLFTLFTTKNITLEFHTQTTVFETEASHDDVLTSVNFYESKTVFFMNKKKLKEQLEKNNPYIEIINIETVFPSDIVVHALEREPIYAFTYGQAFLITDSKLKVLDIADTADGYVLFETWIGENHNFPISQGVEKGDFLQRSDFIDDVIYLNIIELNNVFLRNSRGPGEIRNTFKTIAFTRQSLAVDSSAPEEKLCLTFTDKNDFDIIIFDIFDDLTRKMQHTFSVLARLTPDEYAGNVLFTYKHSSNKIYSELSPNN